MCIRDRRNEAICGRDLNVSVVSSTDRKVGTRKLVYNKLAPYGTDGRLLLTANFEVTWHKNYDKNQKSGPDKL